ncbi:FAD-binding oxidoreductase [Micromonospora sp. SCSIO 07396]
MRRRTMLAGALTAGGTALARTRSQPPAAEPAVSVGPDDRRYADLTVGNNVRWTARPDEVRIVHSAAQVRDAVQDAVSSGRRLSVRGGGHCYCDFVYHSDVRLVLALSGLDEVGYDKQHRAFSVGGGATLLNAYAALYNGWGVTIPGGTCYSVGVGGHIAGGGYGLLSRRHGLTVDHLFGVEVVTVAADGKARVVLATRESDDPHRDLWWAHTGGGGGNFGVVTRYLFRSPGTTGTVPGDQLVRPPRQVLVNAVAVPWSALDRDAFATMVRRYSEWHTAHRGTGDSTADLCSFLMMNHVSNGSIGMLTVIDADAPQAEAVLADYVRTVLGGLSASARPVSAPVGEIGAMSDYFQPRRLPWLQSVKFLGTNNPTLTDPTARGAHKSAYLRRGFTDGQIGEIFTHLTQSGYANPRSMVVLLSFGGRINEVDPTATAASQRGSVFKALFQSFWNDPGEDARHIGWARSAYGSTFAATGGYPVPGPDTEGCYINYPDTDIVDPAVNRSGVPWHTLYYGANYPRLQRVKAAYDPLDVFRHSQSIALP